MRPLVIMALLGAMLVVYQNCGNAVRTQGLFAEQVANSSVEDDCDSSYCVTPAELLWIKIRESEPYKVDMATLNEGLGHFTVSGKCGIGTFENHSIIFEIRESFGAQRVIGAGQWDNRCDLGQFQVPIISNISSSLTFQPDRKYILRLEIIGLGEGNEPISNPMPANISSLDVVFVSNEE